MKRKTFASSVSNHVYADIHLLEWMCHLCLVGVQRHSINKKDDFHLVGGYVFIFSNSCVAFALSVPSNDVSDLVVTRRVGGTDLAS
jgi:hypothetical protein